MTIWNWVLAPLVRAATNAGAGFLIGSWVGGAIGLALGAVHGWSMSIVRAYDWSKGSGWLQFVIDNTWGLLNSIVGSIYLVVNLVTLNKFSSDVSAGTGSIVLRRGVFPGFATTLGNVVAGGTPGIMKHELIHVLQGRIFGPLYVPSVMLNYAIGTILPYWLIYHDHKNHPIDGLGAYFMKGVYPHTWNEEWAYKVEGTPP